MHFDVSPTFIIERLDSTLHVTINSSWFCKLKSSCSNLQGDSGIPKKLSLFRLLCFIAEPRNENSHSETRGFYIRTSNSGTVHSIPLTNPHVS